MKTKINTTVKVIIFAVIITAAAIGLFLFLSIAFDQKFFNWLYKRFFIDMGYATFLNGGKWHVYDLKWDMTKVRTMKWIPLLYETRIRADAWSGSMPSTAVS